MNKDSNYAVKIQQLNALGGDINKDYDSEYNVNLAILDKLEEGIGGEYTAGDNITIVDKKISATVPTKTSQLTNDSNYAKTSDIPSLDGYATEQWVEEKNYATEGYVGEHISDLDDRFAKIEDIPSLEGYAKENWVSSNYVSGNDVFHIVALTQEEYDAIETKEQQTIYIIKEG